MDQLDLKEAKKPKSKQTRYDATKNILEIKKAVLDFFKKAPRRYREPWGFHQRSETAARKQKNEGNPVIEDSMIVFPFLFWTLEEKKKKTPSGYQR